MAKQIRKPKKRGRRTDRLIIRDDTQAALSRFVSTERWKLRQLKADFDDADVLARAALEEHDFRRLAVAIQREREAIERQSAIIQAQASWIKALTLSKPQRKRR